MKNAAIKCPRTAAPKKKNDLIIKMWGILKFPAFFYFLSDLNISSTFAMIHTASINHHKVQNQPDEGKFRC